MSKYLHDIRGRKAKFVKGHIVLRHHGGLGKDERSERLKHIRRLQTDVLNKKIQTAERPGESRSQAIERINSEAKRHGDIVKSLDRRARRHFGGHKTSKEEYRGITREYSKDS